MYIREAGSHDLIGLLTLYTQLHDNPMPEIDEPLRDLWSRIVDDPNHHVLVGVEDGNIVTSCVVMIVPNLTRGQRPYALVENVITDERYRRKGYANAVLNAAREVATNERCYKIMLMTGAKNESTLAFYRRAGYNSDDKTAFIQWLYM